MDLSIPRRHYYGSEHCLTICPECKSVLVDEKCTILLEVESDYDDGEFMTNFSGSHFCSNCPVVVFDREKIEQAVIISMDGESSGLKYLISGIVDMDAIPEEKANAEIGTAENPVPLVRFLPDLNAATLVSHRKTGRNDLCPCGSGKKYKKCCGK